jgi:glutamyl-tRNA reductase
MGKIQENQFLLVGISHKTAPIDIRERFSFTKTEIPAVLADLTRIDGIAEIVVLSTCNRTEFYLLVNEPIMNVQKHLEEYIIDRIGMGTDFLAHFYRIQGKDVIKHLFNVTCGLDSIILGETQIFGQVKDAYAITCDNGCTGPVFNRLFHMAFQIGKKIRSETSIGEGIVSVSSAAVMMAQNVFGNLARKRALLVGTGKIGKLCAKQLIDSGIGELFITNRTIEHAIDLASELNGQMIPFDRMVDIFGTMDIIVTSVASPRPIITSEFFISIPQEGDKPIALIDLGVPRNIDPDISRRGNIHLFNIDDLEVVTIGNHNRRKNEVKKVTQIVEQKAGEYFEWLTEQEVIPAIYNLRRKCEAIRQGELKRIDSRVNAETLQVVDIVTRRIIQKILHNPTVTMRAAWSVEKRKRLLKSIEELFINEPVS